MTPILFSRQEEESFRHPLAMMADRRAADASPLARAFATLDAERAKMARSVDVLNRIEALILVEGDPFSGDDQDLIAAIRAAKADISG